MLYANAVLFETIIFMCDMVSITPSSASLCLPKVSCYLEHQRSLVELAYLRPHVLLFFFSFFFRVVISDCNGYVFIALLLFLPIFAWPPRIQKDLS